MFGCGVPVCAVEFDCLSELVRHEENGLHFRDSAELSSQLIRLLNGFPINRDLRKLHEGVGLVRRWDANWNSVVLPMLQQARASRGSMAPIHAVVGVVAAVALVAYRYAVPGLPEEVAALLGGY